MIRSATQHCNHSITPMMAVRRLALLLLCVLCFTFAGYDEAMAQLTCNDDPALRCDTATELCNDGLLQTLVDEIQDTLDDAYETMFQSIVGQIAGVVSAMIMLYIVIFGIMFLIGMVQLSLAEISKRMIKIAVVGSLVNGTAFDLFNNYVYRFFREGTDELITVMTTQMVQYISPDALPTNAATGEIGPFTPLDQFITQLMQPGNIVVFEAATNTSAYGGIFMLIFAMAGFFLVAAIARALWVYLVYLLATTLLFGLAPIFFSFLLFERTKNLFNGWLSQLVNFSLQPILMFTFLGFFVVLMQDSMQTTIEQKACICEFEQALEGTAQEPRGWLFADAAGNCMSVPFDIDGPKCMQGGEWGPCAGMDEFPLNMMDMLAFLLLAYTAYSFYNHVASMAQDIAGSFVDLEIGSPVKQATEGLANAPSNLLNQALSRPPPSSGPPVNGR